MYKCQKSQKLIQTREEAGNLIFLLLCRMESSYGIAAYGAYLKAEGVM